MWQICEKVLTMILSVIVTAFIARYLGTEGYGTVNYVISTVLLFTTFSTLGLETISIKDLAVEEEKKEVIIGTGITIRFIGGIALVVLSQLVIGILSSWNKELQILGIIISSSMLFKSFEVIEYYIQSIMKLRITALIRFLSTVVVSIYKLVVVWLDLGKVGFVFSYLIDAIFVAILFYIWYKSKNKEKLKFSGNYAKGILKRCWYLAIAGLMTTIYMRMDQVMLGSMMPTQTENGIYSAAVRIAEMWYFVPLAIIASFQPIIMKYKKIEQEKFLKKQQQLYDIVAIIGFICIIGISIFGYLIVKILYGEEYIGASSILLISIWSGLFATLGSARSPWLISEGLQKYTIVYITSGAIVNTILNFLLIPKFGANGAAFATLVAQMFTSIITVLFIPKMRISGIMMLKAIFKNGVLLSLFKKGINMLKNTKIYANMYKVKNNFLSEFFPKKATEYFYKNVFGKKPDLKNPENFNEKIMWLKLNTYYKNPLITQCVDKIRVRDYVKEKIGEKFLVPAIKIYENEKQINFAELPEKFVLKLNTGSGCNVICKDKSKLDENEIKNKFKKWIKHKYHLEYAEYHYKYVKKGIICEELIQENITDYKFYCFNGQPKFFYVSEGLGAHKDAKLGYFDIELNDLDVRRDGYIKISKEDLILPSNFNEMIEISKKLSEDFPFVRVDLYNVGGKIYFSELTFVPTGGLMKVEPEKYYKIWGDMLDIGSEKK